MNELALFAGAGGGILGGLLLGWRTRCAVELNPYCRRLLLARQRDRQLSPFPIWDDVRTFDGLPWRGKIDVISGGFPCQDISAAGKGAGIEGKKSGLWKEFSRIICEVRPRFVFVENSPMLASRGLGIVLGDLASLGFDAEWCVLGAADVGAPHKRDRLWILATDANSSPIRQQPELYARGKGSPLASLDGIKKPLADSDGARQPQSKGGKPIARRWACDGSQENAAVGLADTDCAQWEGMQRTLREDAQHSDSYGTSWWATEPNVGRVANGVASRLDRLTALGNGQVPLVVVLAWRILMEQHRRKGSQ